MSKDLKEDRDCSSAHFRISQKVTAGLIGLFPSCSSPLSPLTDPWGFFLLTLAGFKSSRGQTANGRGRRKRGGGGAPIYDFTSTLRGALLPWENDERHNISLFCHMKWRWGMKIGRLHPYPPHLFCLLRPIIAQHTTRVLGPRRKYQTRSRT